MGRKKRLSATQKEAQRKLAEQVRDLNATKAEEDAARPINTVRVKTAGRGGSQKSYQRWDGKQWVTGTGKDAAKLQNRDEKSVNIFRNLCRSA